MADQMFWMHSDVEPEGGCAKRLIDVLDADALDADALDVDALDADEDSKKLE